MIGDLVRAFVEGVIARELAQRWQFNPGFRIERLTICDDGEVTVVWSHW